MQAGLGCNFNCCKWMVRKPLVLFVFIFSEILFPSIAISYGRPSDIISAESIKHGCKLEFHEEKNIEINALGAPPHDIVMKWACGYGKPAVPIDRYEVEGGSPEVITTIFWRVDNIVTLVKWSVKSRASDFQGDFYKVYVYKFNPGNEFQPFNRMEKIMSRFGSGWNGTRNGVAVTYPFKDAASIRSRLGKISDW